MIDIFRVWAAAQINVQSKTKGSGDLPPELGRACLVCVAISITGAATILTPTACMSASLPVHTVRSSRAGAATYKRARQTHLPAQRRRRSKSRDRARHDGHGQ